MEQCLHCFAGDRLGKWIEWIPWAELSYNTSIQASTRMTPLEAVYGTPPSTLVAYVPGTTQVAAIDTYLGDLHSNLLKAQYRMRNMAE